METLIRHSRDSDTADHLVPKVHPLTRDAVPEDPLELIATPALGDPDEMLECVVQEFIGMGWDTDGLMRLFENSEYPVLNQLLRSYGPDVVRERVSDFVARYGKFRLRETIADEPDDGEGDEPELIQLTIRSRDQ